MPTLISHIVKNVAKGAILNDDLSITDCYVVKGNGYFAHGDTIAEAQEGLSAKIFENMDAEEAIEKFKSEFKLGVKYPGKTFFEWHHYLTGSCLMGRELFVKNHGLSLDDTYTVEEFINLTKNDYGGEIIRQLEAKIKEEK